MSLLIAYSSFIFNKTSRYTHSRRHTHEQARVRHTRITKTHAYVILKEGHTLIVKELLYLHCILHMICLISLFIRM